MNRILGLQLYEQTILFYYFAITLDLIIENAKRTREFDKGFLRLAGKVSRSTDKLREEIYSDNLRHLSICNQIVPSIFKK